MNFTVGVRRIAKCPVAYHGWSEQKLKINMKEHLSLYHITPGQDTVHDNCKILIIKVAMEKQTNNINMHATDLNDLAQLNKKKS